MFAVWRRSMAFLMMAVLLVPLLVAVPVGAQDASAETPAAQEEPAAEEPAAEGEGTITLDADGDGLIDEQELQIGTDPNLVDTDGDGLNDGAELSDAWGTDPLNADTDGDRLGDGDEAFFHFTDPNVADSDGDGAEDGPEVEAFTDPTDPNSVPGGGVDLDADGDDLSDEQELEIGTDPSTFDTDGDGLGDGAEVREDGWNTDPLKGDTDDDGLGDGDELFVHGTDPKLADSDDDGTPDGHEVEAGTDPNDPASVPPAGGNLGTVTVRARLCPTDYAGKEPFEDCGPLPDVDTAIGLVASEFFGSATTDAAGEAVFADLSAGTYVVTLEVPGDFAGFEVSCGVGRGWEFSTIAASVENRIEFPLLAGDDVICTWFVTPEDARGEPTPTAIPEPDATAAPRPGGSRPVVTLPRTGVGDPAGTGLAGPAAVLVLAGSLGAAGLLARRRRA